MRATAPTAPAESKVPAKAGDCIRIINRLHNQKQNAHPPPKLSLKLSVHWREQRKSHIPAARNASCPVPATGTRPPCSPGGSAVRSRTSTGRSARRGGSRACTQSRPARRRRSRDTATTRKTTNRHQHEQKNQKQRRQRKMMTQPLMALMMTMLRRRCAAGSARARRVRTGPGTRRCVRAARAADTRRSSRAGGRRRPACARPAAAAAQSQRAGAAGGRRTV